MTLDEYRKMRGIGSAATGDEAAREIAETVDGVPPGSDPDLQTDAGSETPKRKGK